MVAPYRQAASALLYTALACCPGAHVAARTIQMLGPQYIGIEAGTMWNDAGVCNSRLVVNGADRKLKYCAHYLDMDGVEDNPTMAGIPMDCYDGCDWDPKTPGCVFQTTTPSNAGTYRHDGGCRQPAKAAAGPGGTPYRMRCHSPGKDCASNLLVSPDRDGEPTTVEAIRGADRPGEPTRVSVRLNPGCYYLQFGTSADSCVPSPSNSCDPSLAACGGPGPCIRVLNITDTEAPEITLLPFCATAPGDDEYCDFEDAVTIEQGSAVDDQGAEAEDLVDGYMPYGAMPCPGPGTDTAGFVCGEDKTGIAVCGIPKQTCSFADTVSRLVEANQLGNQTVRYVAVDRVGNIQVATRRVSVIPSTAGSPHSAEL